MQSNWFYISTKLTKKVALQRWGSHRPAPSLWHETGGVAWFSFLLREVCPAAAAFTFCMYFSFAGEINFYYLGQVSSWAPFHTFHGPALPDPPGVTPSRGSQDPTGCTQRSYCASFHLATSWFAPHCARCWRYLQYRQLSGWTTKEHEKWEKGQAILSAFADRKVLRFALVATQSWKISLSVLSWKKTILAPAAGAALFPFH